MTGLTLRDAQPPQGGRDPVVLQDLSAPSTRAQETERVERVFTACFSIFLGAVGEPKPYGQYETTFSYDPEKWVYPPESDCRKDWNELEK